jgi:hypothetical protein
LYLSENRDCHLQHKLIGFYSRDEECLQRGTDWVFKIKQSALCLYRVFESFNAGKREEDKKGIKERQQCANNEEKKIVSTFYYQHTCETRDAFWFTKREFRAFCMLLPWAVAKVVTRKCPFPNRS